MSEPRSLFYYDRSPSAWLERTAGLSPLARAAYADLEGAAWTAPKRGAQPCSVPDDDVLLARLARMELRDFKKVAAEVRSLYMYRDGVLVDEVLLKTWQGAQGRYSRRVTAGAKGNEAQGKGTHSARIASRNGSRNADALHTQLEVELEAVPPVPDGTGVEQPASGDAPAPAGAARAAANGEELAEFGGAWRAAVQQRGAAAGERAEAPPPNADRERRYFALLAREADAWMALHRDVTKQIGREQRALLNLPATGDLLLADRRALRDAVLEAIRERLGWPTTEEWDESDALTTQTPTGATP